MPADNPTPHRSAEYDSAIRQTIPFYELIQSEAISFVKAARPEPKLWLDIGCGTGYLVELALKCFPHTRFVLADTSEAMLAQAAKRFADKSNRVTLLSPIANDAIGTLADELAPNVITAILCNHYLLPDARSNVTRACYELLGDNGLYVTFENYQPDSAQGTAIALERWKRFQLAQGRSRQTVEDHLRRFGKEFFPVTISDHLRLLAEAGFPISGLFWLSHVQAGFYALKCNK